MVPTQTVTRENMLYRNYTLHPNVDDYFYYNYKNFTSYPLVQNTIFVSNSKEPDSENQPLLFTLSGKCSVNFDVFIKLGNLKPTTLRKVYVRYDGGTSNNSFYKMDWLTIYLYNMRTFPMLVKHNIFVLPNLVLFAGSLQKYILELYIDPKELELRSFAPWRKSVYGNLPFNNDIKSIIMSHLPNHIDIDIWHRANVNELATVGYHAISQTVNMLRVAYRNVYMSSYLIPIRKGCAQFNLHKSLLKTDSIFAIIHRNKGNWDIVPGFNHMRISSAHHNIIINGHDMFTNSILNEHHVTKVGSQKSPQEQYSIPLKFKLTSLVTAPTPKDCELPIHYVNFIDLLGRHLIMGEDADADTEADYVQLDFYTTAFLQNKTSVSDDREIGNEYIRNHIYYLYLELSMGF